jgi:LysM repeat protein
MDDAQDTHTWSGMSRIPPITTSESPRAFTHEAKRSVVTLRKIIILACLVLFLSSGFLGPVRTVRANPSQADPAQAGGVSPYDLILAMNTLRVSFGHPALIEHPIINAVAQATAETMAANNMSWHIGDVRGRIKAAGYGGGATVWATENFAVGTNMSIDQIMVAWADPDHMRPATNPAYCHVGAGVAKAANGRIYYVLQAAYVAGSACGDVSTSDGNPGGTEEGAPSLVPQIIVPVKIATPDEKGKIYHEVKTGQSFWAIAIAYQITIADLEYWNNLSRDQDLQIGQRLFIPGRNTKGYATPTPVGMVVPNPPDEDGKIVHTVEAYQTLSTIARAYQVSVDTLLNLNGLQIDWPLQIGQKLVVSPGPVLSPIQSLTPDGDGRYFHTVRSGETLSGIARMYDITLDNLMAWNGLGVDSIIRPGQSLLLQVTPPASLTPTPSPPGADAVVAATATPTPPRPTRTPTRTPVAMSPTLPVGTTSLPVNLMEGWPLPAALVAGGLITLFWIVRKNLK